MKPYKSNPDPVPGSTRPIRRQKDRADRRLRQYLVIAATAGFLRLLHLWMMSDSPLIGFLMGDPEIFDLWGSEIAAGNWLGDRIFFQAPLYPYLLGLIYTLFGKNLLIVRLFQILLGVLSCLLVAEAGRNIFSKRVGFLSGMLLAVYPPAIFFEGLIQKASLDLFFMSLLLFLISRMIRRPQAALWLGTGLLLGGFVLTRENALVLIPVYLLWLFLNFRKERISHRAVWAIAFFAGLSAVLLPVAVRNKIVGDEFVLTTSNFGFNLYVGNGPKATGTYTSLIWGRADWRYEQSDAKNLAEKETGKTLSPSEVSGYWTRKTIEGIRSDPASWIRLIAKKWLLVWNAVETSDTESIYAHEEDSFVLSAIGSFLHFGTLFPLAFFGICATWKDRSRLWVFYLMLAGYAASIAVFFVFARFRHPMAAPLSIFAAAGLIEGFRLVQEKRFRRLSLYLAAAAITAAGVNWKIASKSENAANTYYNLGVSQTQQGSIPEAVSTYRKALHLNPVHTMAHNNIGIALWQTGHPKEAMDHFLSALKIQPDLAETHNNLGIAYFDREMLDRSLFHFKEVIRLNPDYGAHVYYNLSCIYAQKEDAVNSLAWLRRALDKGYRNLEKIMTGPELGAIRETREFQELVKSLGG